MHKKVKQIAPAVKPKTIRTITDAARAMGVSREHLSRVLHGHRQSRSLTSRYRLLQAEQHLAA